LVSIISWSRWRAWRSKTGPTAILAFAANGLIALFTALSFAEMSSKLPESGAPNLAWLWAVS
jgi:amino acid transporter